MPQIWKNLTFLPGPNKGRYPFCHSLYLDDEVKVIVDPASEPEALKKIAAGKGVDVVLLSHYHEDHWTFMSLFPDAKIYIHRGDAPAMSSLETLLEFYNMKRGEEECERYVTELDRFFRFNPKPPDRILEDGDVLEFGTTRVEVIHTPGHSPGHCCFYFREQDALFLADYDLTKFGPWYGDRVSDIDLLVESSKKVRNHPAKHKIAAHEQGILDGELSARWEEYLDVINRRQRELEEALSKAPMTLEEIVKLRIVYRKSRKPESFFEFGERAIMRKHLERMMKSGAVSIRDGHYVLSAK